MTALPPDNLGWQLDHVAHAVNSIDAALKSHHAVFSSEVYFRELLETEQVEVAFLAPVGTDPTQPFHSTLIELIAPLPGNVHLQKFLSKRGESLHHLAFRVPSIERELKRLAARGVKCIDAAPRKGAYGALVAFLHPSAMNGVLVELVERNV